MAIASEADFREITNELGPDELQHLFQYLDIPQHEIEHAEASANTHDTKLKARAVLRSWKKKNGQAATCEALFEARRKVNDNKEAIRSPNVSYMSQQYERISDDEAESSCCLRVFPCLSSRSRPPRIKIINIVTPTVKLDDRNKARFHYPNIPFTIPDDDPAVQIRVQAQDQGEEHYMQRVFESLVAENQKMRADLHSILTQHSLLLSQLEWIQPFLLLNCNNIPSNHQQPTKVAAREDGVIQEQVKDLFLGDEIRQDSDPSQISMDVQIDHLDSDNKCSEISNGGKSRDEPECEERSEITNGDQNRDKPECGDLQLDLLHEFKGSPVSMKWIGNNHLALCKMGRVEVYEVTTSSCQLIYKLTNADWKGWLVQGVAVTKAIAEKILVICTRRPFVYLYPSNASAVEEKRFKISESAVLNPLHWCL